MAVGYPDGTSSLWHVNDQNGTSLNQASAGSTWLNRCADISMGGSEQVAPSSLSVVVDSTTGAGAWSIYYGDMSITSTKGTVTQINLGAASQLAVQGAGISGTPTANWETVSETNDPTSAQIAATHYLATDHLGSSQMEFSQGGWPVASKQFGPYGSELNSQTTLDHYKFTGKERDTESGLDYFGARYYASSMGRWMSPDWAAKAEPVPYAKLDNPQSLNLYGYVNNNPLSAVDPDGHELHIIIVNTSNQSASTTSAVASGVQQKFEAAGVKNVTVEVVNTSSSFKTYMEDAKGAFGPHTATVELPGGPGQEKGSVSLDKGTNGDTQPRGVSVVDANGVASQQGVKDPITAITNVTAHEVGHDVLDDAKQNSNSDLMSPVGTIPLLNNKNAQFSPADAKKLSDTLNTDKEKKQ